MQKITGLIGTKKLLIPSGIPANQAATKMVSQPATLSPSQNDDDMERINELFLKFGSFYGAVWRKHLGHEEFIQYKKKDWQQGLLKFEDRIVDLAIVSCRENSALPPTLPLFIEICKKIRNRDVYVKAVPASKSRNLEVAKKHLSQIKQMLSGRVNPA